MTDTSEPTKEHVDARSFEERVFARFDALDRRLDGFAARVEKLEAKTSPTPGEVITFLNDMNREMKQGFAEMKQGFARTERKFEALAGDILTLRADISELRAAQPPRPPAPWGAA